MTPYGKTHPDYPNPPTDWDKTKAVRFRGGREAIGSLWGWDDAGQDWCIVAYHSLAKPTCVPVTEREWRDVWVEALLKPGTDVLKACFDTARHFGFIRDPDPVDAFYEAHREAVDAPVREQVRLALGERR